MTTSEKVAYLKGLAEGCGAATADDNNGKILTLILDILEDLALSVDDLDASVDELNEGLDVVSDDLEDVETIVYDDWDDDEDDDDDDDEDEDEDGKTFYKASCPECGEVFTFDEQALEAGIVHCSNCGATIEFEITDDASET